MAIDKQAPSAGWKAHTYYAVDMKVGSMDKTFRAILYVTSIVDCEPGPGSVIFNPNMFRVYRYSEVSYVQAISVIDYNHK